MELKLICFNSGIRSIRTFNRTAYGIEIMMSFIRLSKTHSFNRTAYGIEISQEQLLQGLPKLLLIAPLMELKY